MEVRSGHPLRSLGAWSIAGIGCGIWVSLAPGLGGLGSGYATSMALAFLPVALVASLTTVALFVEGTVRWAPSIITLSLGYILLANVGVVLNPLFFFSNYGAASGIYQRVAGAIVALPLFSLALLAFPGLMSRARVRASLRPFEVWIVVFFVALTLIAFGVGVGHANFWPYVVSDLAKDLVVPAAWIVFRYALRFLPAEQMLRLVVAFALLPPLIDMAYHFRDLVSGTYGRYGGYATLPLTYFMASLLFRPPGRRRLGAVFGVSTMLLSALLSLSRVTWFQSAAILGAGMWRATRMRRGAVVALAAAAVIFAAGVVFAVGPPSFGELLESRFAELFSSQESEFGGIPGEFGVGGISGARKVTETYSVLAHFVAGSVVEWVLGFGAGAEFEHLAPSREIETIYEFRDLKIHNIHNIFAAVLLRKGILGLLVLVALFTSFWYEVRRIERHLPSTGEDRVTLWTIKMYFVLSVLKSLSVDILLWTVEWGALFAVVGSLAGDLTPRDRTSARPDEE